MNYTFPPVPLVPPVLSSSLSRLDAGQGLGGTSEAQHASYCNLELLECVLAEAEGIAEIA
jgi:hypothetical protein